MFTELVTVIIPRKVAKSRGIKMYKENKPCSKGHWSNKWVTDGRCYECAKQRVRDKYDYDKAKARREKYYAANAETLKEKWRERSRLIRQTEPEKVKVWEKNKYLKMMNDPVKAAKERARQLKKQKKAYRENPEKFKQLSKEWNARPDVNGRNRAKKKAYKKANPHIVKALNLKHNHKDRAARKLRLPKWLSSDDIQHMTDLYKLARCLGAHVDHVIPLQGKYVSGLHVPSNLQLLTPSENCAKKNYWEVV